MRPTIAFYCILIVLTAGLTTGSAAVQFSDVFVGGAEGPGGTPYYRIPALITAPNGDLIAFAEARPTPNDPGQIQGQLNRLVYKRSFDGGASWTPFATLASSSKFNYSDARAIVDASSDKVVLLYSQWPDGVASGMCPPGPGDNSSVAFYRSSTDNGQTWGTAVNINSPQVKDPAWAELVTGPGAGIQLRWQSDPARNGRLVITPYVRYPSNTLPDYMFRDVAVYSDNHGFTWRHGGDTGAATADNEAQVVELTNGDLLMDARQGGGSYRMRSISHDGGATWGAAYQGDIYNPGQNAGLIRYSAKRDGDDRDRILYCAGSNQANGGANFMGVYTSYDEGKTFINPVQIDPGAYGYSAMQKLSDGSIGVIYEKEYTTEIRLAKFTLADVEGQNFSSHLGEYDGFGNNLDRKRGGMGWSGSWTGTGIARNSYSARLNGTGLNFAGSTLPAESGRMDLTPSHNTAERKFATPINLSDSSTTYLSLLISQALDTSAILTGKPLDIQLRDASETSRISFGVNSLDQFYINSFGNVVNTTGTLNGTSAYLMLLKIVSQDSSSGNHDQIFLKTFRSGVDAIPAMDAGMAWTLIGSTSANNSAILDRIALTAGSVATWTFDELRIGETFGAVTTMVVPEPGSVALLLITAVAALMFRLSRR